jgi:hypothetical protein
MAASRVITVLSLIACVLWVVIGGTARAQDSVQLAARDVVPAGGTLEVHWQGPGANTDIIYIVADGAPERA